MEMWFSDVLMVFEDIQAHWGQYHALSFLEFERDLHVALEEYDHAIWIRDLIYRQWFPTPLA
jgi:hypothetical protein